MQAFKNDSNSMENNVKILFKMPEYNIPDI
jgi:hypothetical protein